MDLFLFHFPLKGKERPGKLKPEKLPALLASAESDSARCGVWLRVMLATFGFSEDVIYWLRAVLDCEGSGSASVLIREHGDSNLV